MRWDRGGDDGGRVRWDRGGDDGGRGGRQGEIMKVGDGEIWIEAGGGGYGGRGRGNLRERKRERGVL